MSWWAIPLGFWGIMWPGLIVGVALKRGTISEALWLGLTWPGILVFLGLATLFSWAQLGFARLTLWSCKATHWCRYLMLLSFAFGDSQIKMLRRFSKGD